MGDRRKCPKLKVLSLNLLNPELIEVPLTL